MASAPEVSYYDILKVAPDATQKEIDAGFRAARRAHHPDALGTDDAWAFRLVEQAYETLKDPGARAAYDAQLAGEASPAAAPEVSVQQDGFPVAQTPVVQTAPGVMVDGYYLAPIAPLGEEPSRTDLKEWRFLPSADSWKRLALIAGGLTAVAAVVLFFAVRSPLALAPAVLVAVGAVLAAQVDKPSLSTSKVTPTNAGMVLLLAGAVVSVLLNPLFGMLGALAAGAAFFAAKKCKEERSFNAIIPPSLLREGRFFGAPLQEDNLMGTINRNLTASLAPVTEVLDGSFGFCLRGVPSLQAVTPPASAAFLYRNKLIFVTVAQVGDGVRQVALTPAGGIAAVTPEGGYVFIQSTTEVTVAAAAEFAARFGKDSPLDVHTLIVGIPTSPAVKISPVAADKVTLALYEQAGSTLLDMLRADSPDGKVDVDPVVRRDVVRELLPFVSQTTNVV